MMSQIFPIYACNDSNRARPFVDSRYTLQKLEARFFTIAIEKINLVSRKSRKYEKN